MRTLSKSSRCQAEAIQQTVLHQLKVEYCEKGEYSEAMVMGTNEKVVYLLTGDIGGTNSRMALYDPLNTDCSSKDKPLVEKYYRNSEHIPKDCHGHPQVFQERIVIPFLKYCWEENAESKNILHPFRKVRILATLATAGVVSNNRAYLTNLGDMLIDGTAIAENVQDKYLKRIVVCRIINDFVAVSELFAYVFALFRNMDALKF